MKKHRKKTDDNIIEEAIKLASKDPDNIVQALSIIGIAMMDGASVYVPVLIPKDWETYRTTMPSDYLFKDKDGTSWMPVFTRQSKMTGEKDVIALKASLMSVMKYADISDQMEGLVINPHDLQMKFPKMMLKMLFSTIEMTEKQKGEESGKEPESD